MTPTALAFLLAPFATILRTILDFPHFRSNEIFLNLTTDSPLSKVNFRSWEKLSTNTVMFKLEHVFILALQSICHGWDLVQQTVQNSHW